MSSNAALGGVRRGSTGRLVDVCYEWVRERLLDGQFSAGAKLSVEVLARELEVSKQPIMEALRRLANDGLVVIKPQVGCQVSSFSDRQVGDFFQLFGAAEGMVGMLAAQRRTEEQLARLSEIASDTYELHGSADAKLRAHHFRLSNRRFHGVIHEMADSDMTASFSRRMWDLSDFMINTFTSRRVHSDSLEERENEHRRIVDVLREGDAMTARHEVEEHVIDTARLLGVLQDS